MSKTVFGDLQLLPNDTYRIQTEQSTYTVSIHEERGRRYALVRGESGTDRENVVVRDSDPRIGDHSLFDLHYTEWIGKPLDVATMRTSLITAATRLVTASGGVPDLGGQKVVPPGMPDNPRIVPMPSRGTAVGAEHRNHPAFENTPAGKAAQAQNAFEQQGRELARQVVVADAPAQLPYPERHVRYAEDVATLLRSIHRRDRIFDDIARDRQLRDRLMNALDAAERLLSEIKRRNQ
ncbi:MAG: hypothetical protein ABJE66_34275 [Deltaproteobacteria bacterium]